MITLKHILVATDFSEPSTVALAYGRDLARAFGATLHVLHVVADVTMPYAIEGGFSTAGVLEALTETSQRDLAALLRGDEWREVTVQSVVETHVSAAAGIVDYAHANAIDLVVVGTHGRGAVKHFLVGSVAERVVRTAPCPVLTVRTHERDFIAPDAPPPPPPAG